MPVSSGFAVGAMDAGVRNVDAVVPSVPGGLAAANASSLADADNDQTPPVIGG
jgi:hypothetical protein